MCKVRCWRWLFGKKKYQSLECNAFMQAAGAHGTAKGNTSARGMTDYDRKPPDLGGGVFLIFAFFSAREKAVTKNQKY